jgi:hypothetical protein
MLGKKGKHSQALVVESLGFIMVKIIFPADTACSIAA